MRERKCTFATTLATFIARTTASPFNGDKFHFRLVEHRKGVSVLSGTHSGRQELTTSFQDGAAPPLGKLVKLILMGRRKVGRMATRDTRTGERTLANRHLMWGCYTLE